MIVNTDAQTPEAILAVKNVNEQALEQARELGEALAEGLAQGMF